MRRSIVVLASTTGTVFWTTAQAAGRLPQLGSVEASSCLASYLKEKLRPGSSSPDDMSFES